MSPRGRKKQFEQLKEQVMWKKQLKIKKQKKEVETSPILELLSLIFPSPKFVFRLIFHSGWAKGPYGFPSQQPGVGFYHLSND